ncbi:PREDICTED: uncharacterized protein LOC105147120 [Acromyrmex echinatior]|uniref:uncharacterized protein LOC105147120 n=1 Tax=Acromyrmex echinatior TaxID=103372 RepID=UPI000580BD40|nr:PREDICTED: uncharacterized protein LOC105147120 [Acromyrmex echinatior]XP_011056211.1 PREDICTED: uncharacterized protein LOC105147120 [Acromyrmex echinatior]XP_011056212.1 PREDICTED: uncharacterized protein LOC105147120 [Acromyrmex echinatior]XP_011056213.1 PREDICTED: uncharacterized protein LOC105147120 [Acromyrmex echinatior]
MATTIGRITANIGGPGEGRHHVYASMVMSVILYRAIWAQIVAGDRHLHRLVEQLQRLSLRMIAYCTISHEAAAILARSVPFKFMMDCLRNMYLRRREIICRDGFIMPRVQNLIREWSSAAPWKDGEIIWLASLRRLLVRRPGKP